MSAVLVREDKGMQFPIYYVSKTFASVETRYPHLEILALALITAARKLRPYFQCHPICAVTTYPLRDILHKPELSAPGQVKFLLIMTDYFSKRVEAGVYKKIREKEVIDFIYDRIICRFGIPKEIDCDNGLQFVGRKVTKFINGLKIKRNTSTHYHPNANGQAESTNKPIVQSLKKRLELAKGKWRELLPEILCAHRTATKLSTGETPFSLVYGAEALIPVEIGEPFPRYTHATEEENNEAMLVNLDLLEEHREMALIKIVAQKQRMGKYYNRQTKLRYFQVGELVLRRVTLNTKA
ncbi:uncharacterized protein LOC132062406 [Lycium ferocissimum]|uniref:uncharacterized protein LOC132062406 n=1 Tax=Lycium ferocissimum TaxID=112874 RepID=UPI0028159F9F|nr:uncharacterized protein LOC132062406 [Lycium ferocissimum]